MLADINPSGRQKGGAMKGCLTALAMVVLLAIGGCLYFDSGRPRFSGTSPSSIDVYIERKQLSTNDDYRMTITNRAACESILRGFSEAHHVFGASKAFGKFTFHYDSGKTDVVWVFPPEETHCTIALGGTYRMPNERFFQVLKQAGVDVSKIQRD